MAQGNAKLIRDIIDDTSKSTKTTYSSEKLETLLGSAGTSEIVYLKTVSATAPASYAIHDIYFNTSTNLLYEAITSSSWGTGYVPSASVLYVDKKNDKMYIYVDNKMQACSGNVTVSTKAKNAIQDLPDGMYVEDISENVKRINIAQKTVNESMDSVFCKPSTAWTPVQGQYLPLDKRSGTLEVTSNKIKLKANRRYQINANISYSNTTAGYANIAWAIKDSTNNIEIDFLQPFSGDNKFEFASSMTSQYTPVTDCEIGLTPVTIYAADKIETYHSSITVTEIGRVITIDPVEYINSNQGIEDTPVGHVMSVMAKKAPKHYMIADGRELNITDYPYLSQHFIDEFGSVNVFGGDGTVTFKLPDLQGEFLRGAGTNSHINPILNKKEGSGGEVGTHQMATPVRTIDMSTNDGQILVRDVNKQNIQATNIADAFIQETSYIRVTGTKTAEATASAIITTRPTNTSVLFVIKYEPTHFIGSINGYESAEELLPAPKTYKPGTTTADIKDTITLLKPITNFDKIEFRFSVSTSGTDQCYETTKVMDVDNIVIGTAGQIYGREELGAYCLYSGNLWCSALHYNFIANNKVYILRGSKTSSASSWTNFHLLSIRGIKKKYDIGAAAGGGASENLTDADIEAAIDSTITELNKEEI